MAVHIVSNLSSPPQVQSVPLKEVQTIAQAQLERIIGLRNSVALLQIRLRAAEEEVREALESGTAVEPGLHVASLKECFRRNVAWREVCERLATRLFGNGRGAAYCENVLQNTKPSRTVALIVS